MNFFSTILTLFLVQDPIGNIPICFALMRQIPQERHLWFIIRENLIALLILSIFLLSGNTILHHLQMTPAALGIAGGLILCTVAFKMVFPESNSSHMNERSFSQEPFIVPLAIPLLAGPSSMATVTLYASQNSSHLGWCFAALGVSTLLSTAILLLAIPLQKWIQPQLLQAFERLMGVILISMAIQMVLDNIHIYIKLVTP